MDDRKPRKTYLRGWWAHSNFGIPQGVKSSRRDAIRACEELTGKPWPKIKHFMEVWKCDIVPRGKP